MTTIATNTTITAKFITDAELRPTIKVIERKGSFAILELSRGEIVKRKVYSDNEKEYVYPYGKYSMSPIAY